MKHNGLRTLLVGWLMVALMVPAVADDAPMAPDITLASRSGKNMRLAEMRGEVILLNFWASWCGPCREEMPKLEALHQKYKDLGVRIVGINLDSEKGLSEPLLQSTGVSFTILYDPTGSAGEKFGVSAMPSTFIIDRDGKIRYHHKGYQSGYEKTYEEQLKALLRE
jgi:DsbE subfamily thiol:disulfide oxidoreductase